MLTAAQVLAENNFGDTRTGGLAGPMGLFLILLLATVDHPADPQHERPAAPPARPVSAAGRPVDPARADASVVDPTDGTGAGFIRRPLPTGPSSAGTGSPGMIHAEPVVDPCCDHPVWLSLPPGGPKVPEPCAEGGADDRHSTGRPPYRRSAG